jgi:hypothetical protein
MADIQTATTTAPSTPSSGNAIWFVDSTAKILCIKDDTGRVAAASSNAAIATQSAGGFASDTYVTNSDILIPSFGVQAKTRIVWRLSASKTGAGIAAPIYNVRIGALRTVAGDTARLTLTGPAQTAVIDIANLNVMITVRTVGASGVIQGTAWWDHRGTAASSTGGTGFANDGSGHVEGTSSGFDNSALGGSYIGLSVNGGTSAAWTVTQVWAEANW